MPLSPCLVFSQQQGFAMPTKQFVSQTPNCRREPAAAIKMQHMASLRMLTDTTSWVIAWLDFSCVIESGVVKVTLFGWIDCQQATNSSSNLHLWMHIIWDQHQSCGWQMLKVSIHLKACSPSNDNWVQGLAQLGWKSFTWVVFNSSKHIFRDWWDAADKAEHCACHCKRSLWSVMEKPTIVDHCCNTLICL